MYFGEFVQKSINDKAYSDMAFLFQEYQDYRAKQKRRGLNDFNLFTTLLNKGDEVRLHSRFIASLLNPKGLHYQDSLFLEIFLSLYKPSRFSFDLASASVHREHENIDIYLTDGANHIIVENKIYAGDQPNQIARYISYVNEQNSDVEEINIWVIYLTIDRPEPSEYSLGNYRLNAEKTELTNSADTVFYSNLYYSSVQHPSIIQWLEKSLNEVGNLQNLSFPIKQYMEVVHKLTGTYRSKVMTLKEYLDSVSVEEKQRFLTTALKVSRELPDLKSQQMESFFDQLQKRVSIFLPDGWEVSYDFGKLSKNWGYPFRIYNKSNALSIALEFNASDFNPPVTIGVVRRNESVNLGQVVAEAQIQQKLRQLGVSGGYSRFPQSKWWLTYEYLKFDLWTEIVNRGETVMLDTFTNKFMKLVNDFSEVCDASHGYWSSVDEGS